MGHDFKLHFYAWIELLIWLLIISFALGGVKLYQHNKAKELKTYQIFMPDVDGMIVGSPVKFMGVQIGYVQKIQIVNNNVYVKFVLTTKNTEIPQGSVATVEFNGLGGSKSLEITPPTKETLASKQFIVINQPKRIHDSLTLLNEMFDKIDSMAARGSYFVNQFTVPAGSPTVLNPAGIGDNLIKANILLDNLEKNHQDFNRRIKEWDK